MPKFELTEEFIPLDKLLKLMNLVESGGMAHQLIDDGEVKVNSAVELRRRKKLRKGDVVSFRGESIVIE